MNEGWSRRQRAAIVLVSVVASATAVGLSSDKSTENIALILLSTAAAAAVAWLSPSRPAAAFGVLFLVATLSRATISTSVGNMRLEQPAIVAGFAALLLMPSRLDLHRLRPLWPIGASFGLYLACLGLSSVLFAPDRADSLRMTFWTGLSMAGGLLAFQLLARGSQQATGWVRLSGYVQALAGILVALLFFTLGPVLLAGSDPAPGVQDALSSLPKVFALSWEANLYASLLAALTIFGLDRLLSGGRLADKVLVPVMAGAIALGVTRGAYVGLAAGLAVYAYALISPKHSWPRAAVRRLGIQVASVSPIRVWARPSARRVGISMAALAGGLVVGLVVGGVLMHGGRQPTKPLDITQPGFGRSPVAIATGQPGQSGQPAVPSATPTYRVLPAPDTVAFRLDRIPLAIGDLAHSPLIGLGANSFGQRHTDPSRPDQAQPDHIAILAVAALYESGVLGAVGLAIGFGLVLLVLFKAARRRPDRGAIAAYAGALACLLVTYQLTNALNFSLIWLLAGAGLAASLVPSDPPVE
jgi:hypothetical protein